MTMIVVLFLKSFHQSGKYISCIKLIFRSNFPLSSHLLQADSQAQCDHWINSLQLAITNSFKSPNGGLQDSASVCVFR
jgi:hypothetical protein